jgi:hypothetical protein
VGKEDGRINMCKYCTHVYKWKMIPVETILGVLGGRNKEE